MAEAELRLDALLKRSPESSTAWLMKSTAQFHQGDYAGATESSQRAIDLDPSDPEGWVSKGLCLAEAGMNEAAIECYASAIQRRGDHAAAWRETGKSQGRLNRHEEAVSSFNKSLEADPEARETWLKMTPELVARATELYVKGWSTARIGTELGVDASTVGNGLKRASVQMRPAVADNGKGNR